MNHTRYSGSKHYLLPGLRDSQTRVPGYITRKAGFALSLLSLLVCTSSCITSQPKEATWMMPEPAFNEMHAERPSENYRIRIGDEIEILVWEQDGFNTLTTVSNHGNITVPLVGEIFVVGLTRAELERELKRSLSQYIRGEIIFNVSIRSTDRLLISVFGMVTRPDNYPILEGTSIFRVVSMAGGPTDQADMRRVRIYRKYGFPYTETLDLSYYLETGLMDQAAMVYPGDVIFIPKKENAIREMSDFLRDVVLLFGIFRIVN